MESYMKKLIYIGGYGACTTHFEKYYIVSYLGEALEKKGYDFTDNFEEADEIILTDTCFAYFNNIIGFMNYVDFIKTYKKKDANVIISGCATRGLKPKYNSIINNSSNMNKIMEGTTIVFPDKLMGYISNKYLLNAGDDVAIDFIPFYNRFGYDISISLVDGCYNNCSFCKTNFLNFSVKSASFDRIADFAEILSSVDKIHFLEIFSSNLSLYGVDLYNEQLSHLAINYLSQIDHIKYMDVGCLINWYPELAEEIISNEKIKIIHVSLETGSERLYKMMNRPISLEKLKEYLTAIRAKRPDLLMVTEVIAGFPTEKPEDIIDTYNLIKDLNLYTAFVHNYRNSSFIKSSEYNQCSFDYVMESKRYLERLVEPLNNKILSEFVGRESLVLGEEDNNTYLTLLPNCSYRYVNKNYLIGNYAPGDVITEDIQKNKIRKKIYGSL